MKGEAPADFEDVPYRWPVRLRPRAQEAAASSSFPFFIVPAEGRPPERRDGFRILGLVMSIN